MCIRPAAGAPHQTVAAGRLTTPPSARWLETALAILLTGAFYVALYGELPYHDVARFAAQVNGGRFAFDIAHVFLQPVTQLWHHHLGFGEAVEISQKHINTAATALACGVFHALLLRLGMTPWQRIAATVLLAASCSVMTLAPSGHMKLVAFPFVNAALYALVVFEQAGRRGAASLRALAAGALLLATAASLLVSTLATAPFATIAIGLISRRSGHAWRGATGRAALFAALCGGATACLFGAAFLLFAHQPPTLAGLLASVQDKADLKPAGYDMTTTLFRLLFGTANNLIAAPDLGPVGRAWLAGNVPSLRPHAATLAVQSLPWLATLALLGLVYARAAMAAVRGAPCLVPLAFLCGAQAWTIYYGLNDPEHWFQLTAPTLLLFLLLFPPALARTVLPPWAAVTLAVNLALLGLPTERYPLARYQAELRARLSPHDLLLSFAAYPGGPYLGFLDLPGVPNLQLDRAFHQTGNADTFLKQLGQRVDATLAQGGKVFVFAALDPFDWNAPWADLQRHGLTKARLTSFLARRYDIASIAPMAEIKTWQLTPR